MNLNRVKNEMYLFVFNVSVQLLDYITFGFFLIEVIIRVMALGLFGYNGSYLKNNYKPVHTCTN